MMQKHAKFLFLTTIALITLSACSSNETSSNATIANVDLSFSDAAVDDVSEVVISVERITFSRKSKLDIEDDTQPNENDIDSDVDSELSTQPTDDIVVETFKSNDDGTDSETFSLDLLTVQGEDRRLVIDSVELPVGEYSNMLIEVVNESQNASYVVDATGTKALKVPSNVLKLGPFTIEPTSKQSLVVEFGLQQSMTYNPGPDRYILKPRGVRILSVDQAALVKGDIDHVALQAENTCTALETGGSAGAVYLYPGHSLDVSKLADNFDADIPTNADDLIAPVASSSLIRDTFSLSYLEAGDYTLAVSCHNDDDDADQLEEIDIPNPTDQVTEISISTGQTLSCSIPLTETGCESL